MNNFLDLPLHLHLVSMEMLPKDIESKLEFDKIRQILVKYCFGEDAKKYLQEAPVYHDFKRISTLLDEVESCRNLFAKNHSLSIGPYQSIKEELEWLLSKGRILEVESILKIQEVLLILDHIKFAFNEKLKLEFSPLAKIIQRIEIPSEISKAIGKIFDIDGSIKQNASPELSKIFKLIGQKSRALESSFRSILQKYQKKGWLSESLETLRNGRRVLSVKAENKRKIRGIIHDESTTGKTSFVEPDEVIQLNNDLFDLENDKRKEVYKLIKELCSFLRPYRDDILKGYEILVELDCINAKARFAIDLEAVRPKLVNKPNFGFQMAYHPLLKWMNDGQEKKTIPFNLDLHGPNRILVISGPNAGGKSVSMKAVGLLQLMTQSGLLIPVDENSEVGIFKKIYCDIGDQQSLEDDLSTYSSRLKNMKDFLSKADKEALILIDEFGSGTDPKIGGALAEAMLKEFNTKKCFGVVTTHYSNIKFFAFKNRGIVNGSMLFDKEKLKPSYILKVGKPGSSFAFEIANKIGFSKSVMQYAKRKTGKNEKAIDDLLTNLQGDKQSVERKIAELQEKENKLERLIRNYENLYAQLEFDRKKLKLERKAKNLKKADEEQSALKALIKELRQKENLEEVERMVSQKATSEKSLKNEIVALKEEVFYKDKYDIEEFTVGGFAKLREGGAVGKILGIKKNNVEIAFGLIQMQLNCKELIPTGEPIEINAKRSVTTDINFKHGFESKLDIRGYTISDGLDFVQEFLDTALIQNVSDLTIVHGIGTGKLRQAVHQKLKEYKEISKIWHPPEEFGGQGITRIQL